MNAERIRYDCGCEVDWLEIDSAIAYNKPVKHCGDPKHGLGDKYKGFMPPHQVVKKNNLLEELDKLS